MNMTAKSLVSAAAVASVIGLMVSVVFADDIVPTIDPHAHHHMVMSDTTRQMVDYTVPQIRLVRDDGKTVSLPDELNDGRPVVVSFIFTTCTAICPLISQTLAQLQRKLGPDRDRVHLVSISIDPEQDTPARLAAYARKYDAGPEWRYYTGTVSASVATQRAFDVYRGDKMNHVPVTLLRAAPDKPWVRIEGFATANDLLAEIRSMLYSHDSPRADVR
jgi:protein SCO1/2